MTTGYDRAHRLAVIEAAKALTGDANCCGARM